MNVVKLSYGNLLDIPESLRTLADRIESGDYGQVLNLGWVIDDGDEVNVGLLGSCSNSVSEAHILLSRGLRRLEDR